MPSNRPDAAPNVVAPSVQRLSNPVRCGDRAEVWCAVKAVRCGDRWGLAPLGAGVPYREGVQRSLGEPTWYFAYGTNMSQATLTRRGLRPRSSQAARLDGYRLRFSHRGLVFVEPAFANVEAEPGAVVHGVLHALAPAQVERLDRFEGAEYTRRPLEVVGAEAGRVAAQVYLDPHPVRGLQPSRRYLRSCCDGAEEHGLPADYVRALAATPSLHLPVLSPLTGLLVGIAERLRYAGLRPERGRMARRDAGDRAC